MHPRSPAQSEAVLDARGEQKDIAGVDGAVGRDPTPREQVKDAALVILVVAVGHKRPHWGCGCQGVVLFGQTVVARSPPPAAQSVNPRQREQRRARE